MSFLVDMRGEDKRTGKEYASVRNLFSIFLKSLFKKYLILKFPIHDLKPF